MADSSTSTALRAEHELKEVRETRYWLRLAARAELLDRMHHLATLIDEADQLVAMGERLRAWVSATYPGAAWHTEVPVTAPRAATYAGQLAAYRETLAAQDFTVVATWIHFPLVAEMVRMNAG